MSSYLTRLRGALEDAKVKVDENNWSVPGPRIYKLITEGAVRNALQTSYYQTTDVDALVREICRTNVSKSRNKPVSFHYRDRDTSCRRVFALLVLIGKAMTDTVEPIVKKLCDLDLPLQFHDETSSVYSVRDMTFQPISEKFLDCFQTPEWSAEDRRNFCIVQHSLISMVLHKPQVGVPESIQPYRHSLLPWNKPQRNRLANRDDVVKIRIHEGHHEFRDSEKGKPYLAAVKVFKQPGKLYEAEQSGWEVLSSGDRSHIVEFLLVLSMKETNEYHFLFKWPTGTLRNIWSMTLTEAARSFSPVALKSQDIKCWIFEQCLGVVEALFQIHTFPYAHGDIRPQGIFWYPVAAGPGNAPSMGSLKILSFGDPELVDNTRESRLASRGDIWALGCIYLEFIAWYLHGPEGVDTAQTSAGKNIHNERDFFASLLRLRAIDITADGLAPSVEVNKAALKTSLSEGDGCDETVRTFIDFVLLCMLEPDSSFRVGCQRVVQDLRGFNARARQEDQ
ncbi:hypothetical protein GE09DRAFT_1288323 [Coniochaeta sp. 2T2.1]|nr:hypothetical protein GE09DRAFT_1288323 [Coniochaeta sp. 2T2.1]